MSSDRDTYGADGGKVIRCGGRGFGATPSVFRRACPAASDLGRIFRGHRSADGAFNLPDSMTGPLVSDGAAIGAIRTPPGVMGSNPRSSRRPRTTGQTAVRALGLTGSQYHRTCNASWPRRKLLGRARWKRKPLSDYTVANEFAAGSSQGLQVTDSEGKKKLLPMN